MLNHQMEAQGETFRQEGGFREKLSTIRHAVAAKEEHAPECPDCGAPMCKRKAKTGQNAGQEFWGCSKYPACSGLRQIEGIDSIDSFEKAPVYRPSPSPCPCTCRFSARYSAW